MSERYQTAHVRFNAYKEAQGKLTRSQRGGASAKQLDEVMEPLYEMVKPNVPVSDETWKWVVYGLDNLIHANVHGPGSAVVFAQLSIAGYIIANDK